MKQNTKVGSRTLLSLKSLLCFALGPLPSTLRKLLVGRVTATAPLLLRLTPLPWFPLPLLPLEGDTGGLFAT